MLLTTVIAFTTATTTSFYDSIAKLKLVVFLKSTTHERSSKTTTALGRTATYRYSRVRGTRADTRTCWAPCTRRCSDRAIRTEVGTSKGRAACNLRRIRTSTSQACSNRFDHNFHRRRESIRRCLYTNTCLHTHTNTQHTNVHTYTHTCT